MVRQLKGVNSMLSSSTSNPAVIFIRIVLKLNMEDNRRGWNKIKKIEENIRNWNRRECAIENSLSRPPVSTFQFYTERSEGDGHIYAVH